ITRMNPKPVKEVYRGYEYHVTDVATGMLSSKWNGEPPKAALFVANSHTLVLDTPDNVKILIERIEDGKPAPQPVWWEKVNRGVFVASVSNPNKAWTHLLPDAVGPRLPKGGDWERNVLDDLDELLVGLDNRPTTRFYLRASARDPFAGKRMT